MPAISINNVRLAGLAAVVPSIEERSWEDLGPAPERCANARRWKKTPFRRKATLEQCQSDFCVEAAGRLLAGLGWQASEIDVVVMATLTPDYSIPATSIIVQDRLGIPKTAAAFDLPSGPIGFLHGLQTAASMISAGFLKKALLLTGKVGKTQEASDYDAPHREISGDCGSVCALEFCEGSPSLIFDSGGDGSTYKAFYLPIGGVRNPAAPEMFATPEAAAAARDFVRDYQTASATARREFPDCVGRVLQRARKSISDIDGCYFAPMPRLVECTIRKEVGIPYDKYHSYIPDFGRCGSGSIPLTMLARAASRLRAGRHSAVIGGMGAGLAWSAAFITTENLICPEIIEM